MDGVPEDGVAVGCVVVGCVPPVLLAGGSGAAAAAAARPKPSILMMPRPIACRGWDVYIACRGSGVGAGGRMSLMRGRKRYRGVCPEEEASPSQKQQTDGSSDVYIPSMAPWCRIK